MSDIVILLVRITKLKEYLLWFLLISGATALARECVPIGALGNTNLTQSSSYFIDLPPFDRFEEIDPEAFETLELMQGAFDFNNIINKRYWIDIRLCNPSDKDFVKGYLYFGMFDRIFIYNHEYSIEEPALKMGACYKKEAKSVAPSNYHYPIQLAPGEGAHVTVMLSNALFNTYVEDEVLAQFISVYEYPESQNLQKLLLNKGLITIVILALVGFIGISCLLYFISYRQWSVLAFAQICLSIFLYYLRQAEYYFEIDLFWGSHGELMQQTEVLLRGYIMSSFMLYTLVTFDFGKRIKTVQFFIVTSVLVALFDGVIHFIKIDPWKHFTSFDNGLFLFNVLYMCLATVVILFFIWRQNPPQGRLYVYGTIIFVFLNYLSMLVVVQFPETNNEYLTGDMIALYSTTIFLSFMAYITFIRSYRQQEELVKSIMHAQQIEEISKAKSDFYTQVTHEFRTPITIINGIVNKLEIKTDVKEVILTNSNRLLELVNQLLDRAQSAPIDQGLIKHSPTDHIETVEDEAPLFIKALDENGIELPRVLIVEDNKDLRFYISSIIEAEFSILTAANGKEGLKIARKEVPDIIISDLMMPVMDGMEMIEELKDDLNTSHIPVIVLTAKADYESKIGGLKIGAEAYLIKPFDEDELLVRIKTTLENRRRLQKHYEATEHTQMGQKEDSFLQQVKACIQKNIGNESFGIKQICDEVHLERTQLYRKIKALTGSTPSELIKQMRMKHAWQMLKTDTYQIYEVAYACGFKEASYFSKVFKEHFGCQPSEVKLK